MKIGKTIFKNLVATSTFNYFQIEFSIVKLYFVGEILMAVISTLYMHKTKGTVFPYYEVTITVLSFKHLAYICSVTHKREL